ncbi:MAG TPA: ribosome small subunit-dependent GTPase A [Candidatus Limnocylindrales bacterium]|nr:ribosome small subunit-dependent GTPase A [Candidatus Limnocylindrales bacterium]
MNLQALGADSRVHHAFQHLPALRGALILGRVAQAHRDQYRLFTDAGDVAAEPSGALWHRSACPAEMPVTGDWVAARLVGTDQAIVEAVLPRSTCFARRAAGRREQQQPIAANIEVVFLVTGLDSDFNPRRMERYLTLSAESGARPVIVLNKADVCEDVPLRVRETEAVAGGAAIVVTSATQAGGIEALREFLAFGRTVALLGSSGAGKSSIANALLGREHLRTGATRDSGTGRHTTTHRELAPLPGGGAIVDTPGMRELQLWAGAGSVDETFAEIRSAAEGCRYGDCSHAGEPGCAVRIALEDGSITRERWESYRKLAAEARHHERMTDVAAAQTYKRWVKQIHKAARKGKPGRV